MEPGISPREVLTGDHGLAKSGPQGSTSHVGIARGSRTPVWILTEGRTGDDAQLHHLACALGLPYRTLRLQRNRPAKIVLDRFLDLLGIWRRPTTLPADAPDSWPDLVIGVGGASVSTARRIKRASGGRTRTLQLGRPVCWFRDFDLVVTTPQYGVPAAPNVVHLALPFGTVDADPEDTARWSERLGSLPRPWTALLIGGESGSFRVGSKARAEILRRIGETADRGGSLLVSTSRRTPAALGDAIEREVRARLPGRHHLHRFGYPSGDNPYAAYLELADAFVVTGESASMIGDAIKTGRPTDIVPLETRWSAALLVPIHRHLRCGRLRGLVDGLTRFGLWVPPRDLDALHEVVVAALAGRVGAAPPIGRAQDEALVRRVRLLLDPPSEGEDFATAASKHDMKLTRSA